MFLYFFIKKKDKTKMNIDIPNGALEIGNLY